MKAWRDAQVHIVRQGGVAWAESENEERVLVVLQRPPSLQAANNDVKGKPDCSKPKTAAAT